MYVGVDIGGSKTLVAVLDDAGVITEQVKFPTPQTYNTFITSLASTVRSLHEQDFRAAGVAAPGRINRAAGIAEDFGNLPWHHVRLQADIEKIVHCPVVLENDANLAGLSEAMLLPKDKRVLYVTISTGIGTGFIVNRTIDPALADSEGGQMPLEYHGKRIPWEDFASGRAIVNRFHKKAADITDEATWRRIAHDIARGFIELIAIAQPDVIIIGGSVGTYFERYQTALLAELEQYRNPLIVIPTIQKAARPEEAVVYGCYDLAKEAYAATR